MPDASTARFRLVPMRGRDPREGERSASTLELFFDLVFVIAVGIASTQLHQQLDEGRVLNGLANYAVVFFGIWWAWMNFTWFATSFDTDDWLYRVLTIIQMGGVLVLAAGIPQAFHAHDYTILILAYVLMRFALVTQWLRAWYAVGRGNPAPLIYAVGVGIVQLAWLATLLLPPAFFPFALVVLIIAELAVPVSAETVGRTAWNPRHITERYGLFTLIVLGESLMASANAIIEAVHQSDTIAPLVGLAAFTLVVTAALWWIYFWPPHHSVIDGLPRSLVYGYGHYIIFASAGAFSAGIESAIYALTGHPHLGNTALGLAYTAPVALFILGTWSVAIRPNADRLVNVVVPLGALLIFAGSFVSPSIIVTIVILVSMVGVLVWRQPTTVHTRSA